MEQRSGRFVAEVVRDADTGWDVVVLRHEDPDATLQARVVPAAGMNVYSLSINGVELLKGPSSLTDLPGVPYGIPVLYPTPNRVRDAKFTFDGRTYAFEPNERTHFIHGLVHSAEWSFDEPTAGPDGASVRGRLLFEPGSDRYEKFPFKSELALTVTLTADGLRIQYEVTNRDARPLPFGFALHPWFNYLSERANTKVWVPATHRMAIETSDAYRLLPTGQLEDLDGHPADLREPRSLEGVILDDVYFGMRPEKPAGYEDATAGIRVTLSSSPDFTHMVVYTPKDAKWFCMENQTCATDAHNLHAKGMTQQAHLQIVPPGSSASGWVKFTVARS